MPRHPRSTSPSPIGASMPGRPIQMCGVPVHAADAYLARLIRRGFRVAVGEQMEDPEAARGQGADPAAPWCGW